MMMLTIASVVMALTQAYLIQMDEELRFRLRSDMVKQMKRFSLFSHYPK
jgi:hypothetical protein